MRERQSQRLRWAGGMGLALFVFVIPFSKGAVEILFPVLLLTWLSGWVLPWSAYGPQIPKSIGMATATAAVLSLFLFLSWAHLREILMLSDVAARDRMIMWKTTWAMIQDRPFLGLGLNTFMANYSDYSAIPHHNPAYAHNCFLQIAAETGLLGLSVFILLLLGMIRLWRRALCRAFQLTHLTPDWKPILAGLASASVAFLIQSLFDTNLYALRQAVLFWTIAGMATGLSVRFLQTDS